jgi:hypothetical protein
MISGRAAKNTIIKKNVTRYSWLSLLWKETGARGHFHQVRVTLDNVAIRYEWESPSVKYFFALVYWALTGALSGPR